MADALQVARQLIEWGVPVFVARPALDSSGAWDATGGTGGCGYNLPSGWQKTFATTHVLDSYRPGDALCAVMGVVCDVVDVDPRNGGDESLQKLREEERMPLVYGIQKTPSGGEHYLIAPLRVGSKDNVLPGIDVKGGKPDGTGRGFMFIAPTMKVSKTTGEINEYAWMVEPDFTVAQHG